MPQTDCGMRVGVIMKKGQVYIGIVERVELSLIHI